MNGRYYRITDYSCFNGNMYLFVNYIKLINIVYIIKDIYYRWKNNRKNNCNL